MRIANEHWKTPPKPNLNTLSQLLDCRAAPVSMRDSRRNLSELSKHQAQIPSICGNLKEQDAIPLSASGIFPQDILNEIH